MPTKAELETQNRALIAEKKELEEKKKGVDYELMRLKSSTRAQIVIELIRLISKMIVPAMVVLVVYFLSDVLIAQAGQTTMVQYLSDLKVGDWLPWCLAVLGGGWGVTERNLHKRHIEHHDDHVKKLETALDPSRTSSGLTKRGDTP